MPVKPKKGRIDKRLSDIEDSLIAALSAVTRLGARPLGVEDVHTIQMIATQASQATAEAYGVLGSLYERQDMVK